MPNDRVFAMSFADVYPHYVAKAEEKGRTKEEVDPDESGLADGFVDCSKIAL